MFACVFVYLFARGGGWCWVKADRVIWGGGWGFVANTHCPPPLNWKYGKTCSSCCFPLEKLSIEKGLLNAIRHMLLNGST